jgi:dihydrolipoamide dehydrogenase
MYREPGTHDDGDLVMADNSTYDVIIIGSGPGGYVAAVHAAQHGLNVACIEKAPRLGGVCLNVGCIPSKALLDSSEYLQLAKSQFADHGIKTGRIGLDLAVMMARKEKVVQDLTENVKRLLEGHKVEIITGTAQLVAPDQVSVELGSGSSKKRKKPPYLPRPLFWPPAVKVFLYRICRLTAVRLSVPPML